MRNLEVSFSVTIDLCSTFQANLPMVTSTEGTALLSGLNNYNILLTSQLIGAVSSYTILR